MLHAIKVKPPIRETIVPPIVPAIAGERRISRYTPALTIVALCSRALGGVGATIAPSSQEENGSWADLVSPARASSAIGIGAPTRTTSSSCTVPSVAAETAIAMAKPRPPKRFIHSARKLLCTASSVRV